MPSIDWNKFGVTGVSKQDSFEELCLHLFCRKHGLDEGVSGDFNQAGLETQPVRVGKRVYGFQSKHFDAGVDYPQIEKSISTALRIHGSDLDEICIFINAKSKPNSSQGGKAIKQAADKYGVKIQWYTRTNFEVALTQPKNLDLAYFYFGYGSEFKFIEDSADYSKITFLKSKQFLKLSFLDTHDRRVSSLDDTILKLPEKLALVSGDPASGKSTLVHSLFLSYSGMGEMNQTDMINRIIAIGAVPQIINLKLCATDSLENTIRNRQDAYSLQGVDLKIIYLLDGLDEVSEDKADLVLLQMLELSKKKNTYKIIVTCRTGNFNKIQLKNYFNDCVEFKIGQLGEPDIYSYFKAKGVVSKQHDYARLKSTNQELISSITDVLSLTLFWDSIEQLNSDSTAFDLYALRVNKVLEDPIHHKDLPSLNLPNPKSGAIISLNETISYRFQQEFQFLLPIRDLQGLISESYPKIDYSSINKIVNYISGLFFDTSSTLSESKFYTYKHRRYQEYFFVTLLQKKYSEDPGVLRGTSILSSLELFQTFFMKGLRKKYIDENSLIGCLDLSLLDVYLGNHSGWGADGPYYLESPDFMKTLASQQDEVFNTLFEDESLNIRNKIFVDVKFLKKEFTEWKKDSDGIANYRRQDTLIAGWEIGLSRLINLLVDFWQTGRKDISSELIDNIREVQNFYSNSGFFDLLDKQRRQYIRDPYSESFKSSIFYLMNIKKDTAKAVLYEVVIPGIEKSKDKDFDSRRNITELADAYLSTLINDQPSQLSSVVDELPDIMMIELLKLFTSVPGLNLFIKSLDVHDSIKRFVVNYDYELSENNYYILFFKKYFSLPVSPEEQKYLSARMEKIVAERDIDWHIYGYEKEFALIAYVLDSYSFEQQLARNEGEYFLNTYAERVVYAALYSGYIRLITGQISFEYLYRQYASYCSLNSDTRYLSKFLLPSITELWVNIYGHSQVKSSTKKLLSKRLLDDFHIPKYSFYLKMSSEFPALFNSLVSEADLELFESKLTNWGDDFQSKVDRYLDLSRMYKDLNPQKASDLFVKAIVDGTLRHGWRKDSIVHYNLVNALGVMLERQWLKGSELDLALDQVWSLVLRAYDISDGKGTSRGPYRYIETVAMFDVDIAIRYKDRYVEREGRHNVANTLYTPIILSGVHTGLPIESVEKGFTEFRMKYDYESKPYSEYYEQKFVVYLEIAKSDLYPDDEKIEALNKANQQISAMEDEGLTHYLSDSCYGDEVASFLDLCKKFNINPNISRQQGPELTPGRKYSPSNEIGFRKSLSAAKTKQKIRGAYKRLQNYKNGIELRDGKTWKILIDKTYELFGDINLFVSYLEGMNYPHSDNYSANARNAHLGLAYALQGFNSRQEALSYLYLNGGHGGFYNLIKTYAYMGDREMTTKLFNRYVSLCKLLTE